MSSFRIPDKGQIDYGRPLSFQFNGRQYSGFKGDTLASALLAEGVQLIGRSFKLHRPRGIYASGYAEPNAIVQTGTGGWEDPNQKATCVELYEGLKSRTVNAWPSLDFDVMAVNSALARFLPAGFYYKTFMRPGWTFFEPIIRRAAGLGGCPTQADEETYEHRWAVCDVLVLGGGPAGLSAALGAARAGAKVFVVEADRAWGGSLIHCDAIVEGATGIEWAGKAVTELDAMANVTTLNRTLAFGVYDHNLVALAERLTDHLPPDKRRGPRQRLWKIRARRIIVATGSFEQPMVFPNNDRPGVMLAGAGAVYAGRYGVAAGRQVTVATNNDSGYANALMLTQAGVNVTAIVDVRESPPETQRAIAAEAGIRVLAGCEIVRAVGRRRIEAIELRQSAAMNAPQATARSLTLETDCLLTSGGRLPALQLFAQAGGKLRFEDRLHAFVPREAPEGIETAGACNGQFELADALQSGLSRGVAAAQSCGFSVGDAQLAESPGVDQSPCTPLGSSIFTDGGKAASVAFVDLQNDVSALDIELAVRESFRSVEHVKRYTTLGMATDQGKTSNLNGIGLLGAARKEPIAIVGTTKFRPPFDPIPIGLFAGQQRGRNLQPRRELAAAEQHLSYGASMDDYGGWMRPSCYPRDGESESAAIAREARQVRSSVGVFEASPLGKIELLGPDVEVFLNRIYVNTMKTLKPGRCRYGLMLTENGVIFDDGVVSRLSDGRFLVSTTSGHASAVADMFDEWLQCEWPDLDVAFADITTCWAVFTVAGPGARDLLQQLDTTLVLAKSVFPHMSVREGQLCGIPCRIQRVSFTGELSYEISVPWSHGSSVFEALLDAGVQYGAMPFGVETLMTLRTEKGYLHVGTDTDGTTMPQDVGFGPVIDRKPDDFIGRRSTMSPHARCKRRRQLVGFQVLDGMEPLTVGAHVVSGTSGAAMSSEGWISSSVRSEAVGRPVAIGLLAGGRARIGEEVFVWDIAGVRRARVAPPCAFDPDGERLHA